ncbi:uncharacterized protein [Eucyclogobius newberryi]|uniref:uncharacterized protein n=1 Tax=Eucyclogobius newberryi TaxID=166745 RepID=UPI003B58C1B7
MDDPGGPGAGRTFWTFWNYITDIVGRFLRPEPPGTEINDTNSTNSVNDELLDSRHERDNFSTATEEGEEVFVPVSSVGSTRPVAFWDSGSELQTEKRQDVVEEDEKISEREDGVREEEIETGIDVAAHLPVTLTAMNNHDQSGDITMKAEEPMPMILVNSAEEIINIDIEASDRKADKPQTKEQPNESFNELKKPNLVVEAGIASELDTRTAEQEPCERRDGKQSDNMALEEKLEHVECDNTEESVKYDDDDTNAMKGEEENKVKIMIDEEQHNEIEMTIEVTDGSDEDLNEMYKEDMNKLHFSLVLDDMSRQDDNRESYEGKKDDAVVMQNNPDMEENPSLNCLERLSSVESPMADNNNYVVVPEEDESQVKHELTVAYTSDESANLEPQNGKKEFKKDQNAIAENDVAMTNLNATLDNVDGDNSTVARPALNIDQDMTQQNTYTLGTADDESGSEEVEDAKKDDLVLEIEPLRILCYDVLGTDDTLIIQEGEPCTSEQEEHTAIDRNEESGYDDAENKTPSKPEQDIMEKESDKNNSITEDLTRNIEAGLETHSSRFDLALEGISDTADPVEVSKEIDRSMGKFCVAIKNEGGFTQEPASALKNIPMGEWEGKERAYSFKESSEEVPDYNNESDSGSATQRFLEEGNCRESQTTLLQEEAECGEAKCLQNSGSGKGEGRLEDFMETELVKNSLEEHIAETTRLADMTFESFFVLEEDVEEKEEDLKEEAREIEFEMRETCDVVDGADIQDSPTEFQNYIFLDQSTSKNESNVQGAETQTASMDCLSDTEDGLFTFEEQVVTVKSENVRLQASDEDSTIVSNVLADAVHRDISANALSVEDVHQRCILEQLMSGEVIEDEILDLWIQQTSMVSDFEVRGEDQGREDSQCDLPEEEKAESMHELSIAFDVNEYSSTAESEFFEQSLDKGASLKHNEQELPTAGCTFSKSEDLSECSVAEPELETPWSESLDATLESTDDDGEAITSRNIDVLVSISSLVMQNGSTFSIQTDDEPVTTLQMLSESELLTKDQSDSLIEIEHTLHMTVTPTEGCQLTLQEKSKVEALQEFERVEDIDKTDVGKLDFTPQKSRIAVKNPSVRPPKDFRLLLHKPSLEPSPPKHLEHVPAGVPMSGLGIRVKLPGLGTGFPVLKKTKKTEEEIETATRETKPVEEDDDKLKQEDSQQRPKWMPPSHPGFGNPLMSELKSKLKKTTKE